MALVPNRRSQPNVEPWFRLISSSDCTFVFVNNFVRSQATFFLWPIIPQLHWSRIIQRVKSLSGTIHHLSYGPENEYLLCTSWSCFFLANNLIESHYPENYISFGWRTNIYLPCNSPLSGGVESEYLLYTCHVFLSVLSIQVETALSCELIKPHPPFRYHSPLQLLYRERISPVPRSWFLRVLN